MVKKKYTILLSRQARKDFDHIKAAGLSSKLKKLYNILLEDPFTEYPRYEALVGDMKGLYSRRINIKHRLVYSVDKKTSTVKIYRMWTHYGE